MQIFNYKPGKIRACTKEYLHVMKMGTVVARAHLKAIINFPDINLAISCHSSLSQSIVSVRPCQVDTSFYMGSSARPTSSVCIIPIHISPPASATGTATAPAAAGTTPGRAPVVTTTAPGSTA